MSANTLQKTVCPKAGVTLSQLGPGFGKDKVSWAGSSTFKLVHNKKLTASLALTQATLNNVQSFKDVVLTADYKAQPDLTINTKYDLGIKKFTAGVTVDRTVADKATTLKAWYSNKDNLVAGEATIVVAKGQKAFLAATQKQLLSAKYTYTKGDLTAEPSWNFKTKSPALSLTKKVSSQDSLKLTYDLKSEAALLEWSRAPFKVGLVTTVSKKFAVAAPNLTATFEKTYSL